MKPANEACRKQANEKLLSHMWLIASYGNILCSLWLDETVSASILASYAGLVAEDSSASHAIAAMVHAVVYGKQDRCRCCLHMLAASAELLIADTYEVTENQNEGIRINRDE